MFMDCKEECHLRTEALMMVTEAAQQAGMANETLERLAELVIHTNKNVTRWASTGERSALVEQPRLTLKPCEDLNRAVGKLRPMPTDTEMWLQN